MKIICDKQILNDVINTVQKAVSTKPAYPILECIKIDADAHGNIEMTGNNLELCIEYHLDCNVPEGGSIALASRMFGEIVRRLPDGDVTIDVNEKNNVTKIKCGLSEFNIQGLNGVDYPKAPELEERFKFTLKQDVLKRLIRKISPFISVNEAKRPVLTGALFDIRENNTLKVVATDGKRLAVGTKQLEGAPLEPTKFVVPGNTLREMAKILKDDDADVEISCSDRHVLFDFGYYKVFTRLLDGDFLKYDPILSSDSNVLVNVNKNIITNSLERAMLIINDDDINSSQSRAPVKLNFEFGRVEVNCITSKGQVHDEVDAGITGGPLNIGFNCKYLLDAISACDDDFIKLEMSTPTAGCFIRSQQDETENYIFMVLPVRLYD